MPNERIADRGYARLSVLLLLCLALTAVLWITRGWIWLGVPPINPDRPAFSDTYAHLATAVNCADGLGEWHGRVCFVPDIEAVPRAQTYEPWLTLHRLGIDTIHDVYVAAVAIIILFYLAMLLSFRPAGLRQALLLLALLATTGIQLAVERGNFDLLIAALLCLAGALLAQPKPLTGIAGALVLSLTTMLKLYTGLACALAWLAASSSRWLMVPVSIAAVALAVFVVGPRELLILAQGAPEGSTRFSTGARWLFIHAGSVWGTAAIAIALAGAGFAARYLSGARLPDFRAWPRRTAIFKMAFLTAIPLFLLKDSYDYRLVLWLPCLALPFAWLRGDAVDPAWRKLAITLVALFAFVSGVELPCTWLDALMASTGENWPGSIAKTLSYGKQFAAWTLAALLTLVFVRSVRAQPNATAVLSSQPIESRRWA